MDSREQLPDGSLDLCQQLWCQPEAWRISGPNANGVGTIECRIDYAHDNNLLSTDLDDKFDITNS